MSKKDHILALYDGTRTTKEIAEIVGCLPAYVRVVARQRRGSGDSAAQKRYLLKRYGTTDLTTAYKLRARECYADPIRYAMRLDYQRAWRRKRRDDLPPGFRTSD